MHQSDSLIDGRFFGGGGGGYKVVRLGREGASLDALMGRGISHFQHCKEISSGNFLGPQVDRLSSVAAAFIPLL